MTTPEFVKGLGIESLALLDLLDLRDRIKPIMYCDEKFVRLHEEVCARIDELAAEGCHIRN